MVAFPTWEDRGSRGWSGQTPVLHRGRTGVLAPSAVVLSCPRVPGSGGGGGGGWTAGDLEAEGTPWHFGKQTPLFSQVSWSPTVELFGGEMASPLGEKGKSISL